MSINTFREIAGTIESVRLALSAARDYRIGAISRRQRMGSQYVSK